MPQREMANATTPTGKEARDLGKRTKGKESQTREKEKDMARMARPRARGKMAMMPMARAGSQTPPCMSHLQRRVLLHQLVALHRRQGQSPHKPARNPLHPHHHHHNTHLGKLPSEHASASYGLHAILSDMWHRPCECRHRILSEAEGQSNPLSRHCRAANCGYVWRGTRGRGQRTRT